MSDPSTTTTTEEEAAVVVTEENPTIEEEPKLPTKREIYAQLEQKIIELINCYQDMLKKVRDYLNDGQIGDYTVPLTDIEAKIEYCKSDAEARKAEVDSLFATETAD